MFSRIIKYLGIILIISFSAISTLIYTIEKGIPNYQKQDSFILNYPAFFEDRFFDLRMKQTLDKKTVDKDIVLAAITDEGLEKIGRWPWTRTVWTNFVDKMNSFGAKILAFDVFFSEPELSCNGNDVDQELANAFRKFQLKPGNKIILPYKMNITGQKDDRDFTETPDDLYNFIMDSQMAQGLNLEPHYISKDAYPLNSLTSAEIALGHIQASSDSDGIYRHYFLASNNETLYFPSFSLLTYQEYTGDKPTLKMVTKNDQAELITKTGKFYLNPNGSIKVRWKGDTRNFHAIDIKNILAAKDNDPEMKKIFDGKIVFIGSTAFGANDIRHTPVSPLLPGVYFHMNMASMLINGKSFLPQEKSTRYTWAILFGATLLILLIQLLKNALLDLVSVIVLVTGLFYFDTYYLIPKGFEIRLFFCFFSVVVCYSWVTFINFYLASKDKNFLKNAFSSYISPELIDDMYKSGEPPKLGGDSGIRTAYFTDIQSFSTFSEKLSATQLVELLNEYLTEMTDILLEEKGTLDKYEGDAIIAFFGAPMPLEDHATKACKVAHKMQESLLKLREKWVSEGDKWPKIVHEMRMRIGINSGEIVTGNMGSASRMNYTMMGDSVNLAARLEESAKQYGIFTQVSAETVEMTEDIFIWRELDTIKVVGKSVPVTTFDLLGMKDSSPEYLKALSEKFKEGITLYKSQHFDQALNIFKETLELEYQRFPLLKGVKTNPSEIYIKRCEDYISSPPPSDWDGVYTLTSK